MKRWIWELWEWWIALRPLFPALIGSILLFILLLLLLRKIGIPQ